MQRIFGEYHEVHGAKIAPRLADHVDDAFGLAREVSLGHDDGQLQLNEPDDDAFRRFVEAAKSVHATLLEFVVGANAKEQTRLLTIAKDYFFRHRPQILGKPGSNFNALS